jgi:hypothetical protein
MHQCSLIQVGEKTDDRETQCFSTHLTTFAGGFIVLPKPINWSYVFANADFMKNKTVYLTIITVSVLFIILLIYGRYKDKKDAQKVTNLHFANYTSLSLSSPV